MLFNWFFRWFFLWLFLWVFTLSALWPRASFANDNAGLFKKALVAYQKGDFAEAKNGFEALLKNDGEHPTLIYNLGLVEMRLGHKGRAIALWRKALAIDSGYRPAEQAVNYASKQLERREIAHEVEFWESLHDGILAAVPILNFVFVSLLILVVGGWLWLRYLGAKRHAAIEELTPPNAPIVASVLTVLWAISLALVIAKIIDSQDVRATIIEQKTAARSSPDINGTPLFDLYEGLEVLVRQRQGDWTQVTYPGGATGWVPLSSLMTVNDRVVL